MIKRLVRIFSLLFLCLIPSGLDAADTGPAGILYAKPIESVIFRHQDHVKKDTSCSACHSGLFEMEALRAQNNKDFNMDSLYKGKYCGACHNGRKAFASDTQCARCHLGSAALVPSKDVPVYKNSVILGRGGKGMAFNHETHVKKSTCQSCHPSLFEPKEGASSIKMADHTQGKTCFTCHDQKGKKAFAWSDCSRCHKQSIPAPKGAIHFGTGKKAVAFSHESHQLKGGCKACHPKTFSFKKGTAKIDFKDHSQGKTCFACHDQTGKNAFAWGDCSRCHKQSLPAPKEAIHFGKGTKAVAFSHENHQMKEGCKACHPKTFSFKKGTAKIGFKDHSNGQSCFTCHAQKGPAFYDCNRCHKK